MFQHGAYTLLLDACYDREEFPTLEQAIEWTWASTKDEIDAVNFILKKFFFLENGVFVQKRVQEELKNYKVVSEINTRIAIERETKRKEKSTKREPSVHEAPRSDHEAPPNHKPLTINHKPLTNKEEPSGFALFWNPYKKKVGRPAALRAFKAQHINGELPLILADIERRNNSEAWQKNNGQFIPNPATYLNQRRWEDQVDDQTSNMFAEAF